MITGIHNQLVRNTEIISREGVSPADKRETHYRALCLDEKRMPSRLNPVEWQKSISGGVDGANRALAELGDLGEVGVDQTMEKRGLTLRNLPESHVHKFARAHRQTTWRFSGGAFAPSAASAG